MESPASLWSVAVALGSALLGVLVFVQTGLGVFKLRLEIQKLRDERKGPAEDAPPPRKANKPARKPRPTEQKIYRGAVLRWVLVGVFLLLTVLSYSYLKAQQARRLAEMERARATYGAYEAHKLQERSEALAKELAEARALLQRNNIPLPKTNE
jgi:hypothetical protein